MVGDRPWLAGDLEPSARIVRIVDVGSTKKAGRHRIWPRVQRAGVWLADTRTAGVNAARPAAASGIKCGPAQLIVGCCLCIRRPGRKRCTYECQENEEDLSFHKLLSNHGYFPITAVPSYERTVMSLLKVSVSLYEPARTYRASPLQEVL